MTKTNRILKACEHLVKRGVLSNAVVEGNRIIFSFPFNKKEWNQESEFSILVKDIDFYNGNYPSDENVEMYSICVSIEDAIRRSQEKTHSFIKKHFGKLDR